MTARIEHLIETKHICYNAMSDMLSVIHPQCMLGESYVVLFAIQLRANASIRPAQLSTSLHASYTVG